MNANDIGNVQAGIVTPLPDAWPHRLDVVISLKTPAHRDGSHDPEWSTAAATGFSMLFDAVDWEGEDRLSDTASITFGVTAQGHRHLRLLIPSAPPLSMLEATAERWTDLGDTPRTYEPPFAPGRADIVLLLAGPDAAELIRLADALASAFGPLTTQHRIASEATHADVFGFAEGAGNPRSVGAEPPDARAELPTAFNAAWFVCASLPGSPTIGTVGNPVAASQEERGFQRWRRGVKKDEPQQRDPVQPSSFTDPVRSTNFAVACRSGDTLLVWRKLEQHATNFGALPSDEARALIVGRRRDGRALAGGPPEGSHVARSKADGARGLILRRSSRYATNDGSVDRAGLVFRCFQRDIAVGYEWVQRRLAVPDVIQGIDGDDPLTGTGNGFVTARGGDYYLVPGHSRVALWQRLLGDTGAAG